MRQIAIDQDYVRYPLTELFATRANVRLLRVLSEDVSGPIGAREAADHTGLTEAGARRALRRLVKTGFVEQIGGGRGQQFRLRDSDPISNQLTILFRTEKSRYQSFISQLRKVFQGFLEIQIAWIDVPPLKVGQPLHIGVLANSRSIMYLTTEIRKRILMIEREFDITIEVHAFSRADIPDVNWESTTLLSGHFKPQERPNSPGKTHFKRLERSARMSKAIAQLLDNDQSLRKRAMHHLDMLLDRDEGAAAHDLHEWREILEHYSNQRIKNFLVAETPRAQRLRQSSPFFAVLTPGERDDLLDELEQNYDS